MKTNLFRYIFSGIVSFVTLVSCQGLVEEPAYKAESDVQASLTIDMRLPVEMTGTKSIANDPRNANNTWSEWEQFADGSLLYNLTLFVIDSENKLVGYRQIHSGSADVGSINGFYDGNNINTAATSGTGVKITFPQSDPLHGNIELLRAGTYTLIAVANHAAVTSGDKTYAGLGKVAEDGSNNYNGEGDFTSIVNSIIAGFSNTSGVANFNASNYSSFFKYRLNAGDDRVCKVNPQPLVMIRKVTLGEGNNVVKGELSRTFARIRLEVLNKSDNNILDISSLSFNGSFASKNAYLFNDAEAGTANYFGNFSLYEGNSSSADNTKGLLNVSSSDAVISAAAGINKRVLAGATEPIFDAYILEGKIQASADYAFSFTGTYAAQMEDGDATHNVMIGSFFSNSKYNGSTGGMGGSMGTTSYGIIDPAFYIFIRSRTSNVSTCLKADTQTMTATVENTQAGNEQSSSSFKMSPEFIWEMVIPGGSQSVDIESSGNPWMSNNYIQSAPGYLKSISSNLYVQPYDGSTSKVPVLGSNPGNLIFKMDFGSEDEHGTVFCQYNGSYYYLNGTTCQWTGPVANMNTYKMQTFETIIAEPVTPKSKEITSYIQHKNSTGNTVRKDEIVRNDFFHGIIPVSIQE